MESLQPLQRTPRIEGAEGKQRSRLLILCALAIGVAFDRLILSGLFRAASTAAFTLRSGGFWMLYLALFIALAWERAKENREAWFFAAAAALLVVRGLIYAQRELLLINVFALPLLLMLHAVLVRCGGGRGCEGRLAARYFAGWFVWPLSALRRCAGMLGGLFKKRGFKIASQALLGAFLALPALVFAGCLLGSADAMFLDLLSNLAIWFDTFEFIRHLLSALIAAALFCSFLYNAAFSSEGGRAVEKERPKVPSVTLGVALSLLLVLYAVFAYIQFTYLTGLNGLPPGFTYSEYARSGFAELLCVCAVNLGLFALCLAPGSPSKPLRALLYGLLAASAVMLGSALTRLLLYVDAYGLTFARFFSLWLIAFLAFALIACAIRLLSKKMPLLRLLTAAFMLWYLALNFINVDGIIAANILGRAAKEGFLGCGEAVYVEELSSDADAVREAYRELLR